MSHRRLTDLALAAILRAPTCPEIAMRTAAIGGARPGPERIVIRDIDEVCPSGFILPRHRRNLIYLFWAAKPPVPAGTHCLFRNCGKM